MVIVTGLLGATNSTTTASMSYTVSGTSTIPASDSTAVINGAGSQSVQASAVSTIVTLTAGTNNVFTLVYKVAGTSASGTFANRTITVIPLN